MVRETLRAGRAWVRNRLRIRRRGAPDPLDTNPVLFPVRPVNLRDVFSPEILKIISDIALDARDDLMDAQSQYWVDGLILFLRHFGYHKYTRCDITDKVDGDTKANYFCPDVTDKVHAVDDPTSRPEAPDFIKKKFILYRFWSTDNRVLTGAEYAIRRAQQMINAVAVFKMYLEVEPTQRGVIIRVGKYYVWCLYYDGEQFWALDLKLASTFNISNEVNE